jgi:4-hydroxy-tetrahydrodipicolinate synthase
MTNPAPSAPPPFGRALCAMVTPFTEAGALDLPGAQLLAVRLVSEGCDGLVLSGTTGESPTTSDAEKAALVAAVREAVGDGVPLVSGVGTSDTRHTVELARQAEQAGADGVLVVSPYYSRPPQDALEAHFREVADASGLPLVLYDIPGRTGTRIEPETLIRLAEHPRIVAVKDCSYDFLGTQKVLGRTDLAYYAGCDEHILALYAVGGLCEHGRERRPGSTPGDPRRVRGGRHPRVRPPPTTRHAAHRVDDGGGAPRHRDGQGAPQLARAAGWFGACAAAGRRPGCGRRAGGGL